MNGSTNSSVTEKELRRHIDSLLHCLQGRFEDLQYNNAFKGMKLLDISMWPTDPLLLQQFGQSELSLVIDHFFFYTFGFPISQQ